MLKKEKEIFSLGQRMASDSLLGGLIKCAQLASTHYYSMSIDFGLKSRPDKMVQGLVVSDCSKLQICLHET